MSIYFYGAGKRGMQALNMYKTKYSDSLKEFNGFIDKNINVSIAGYSTYSIDEINETEVDIIITVKDIGIQIDIYRLLYDKGFRKLFIYNPEDYVNNTGDFLKDCCRYIGDWGNCVLKQVEMHIVDGCNLNCRGCAHFSPIFDKKLMPDFQSRIDDVVMLKEKFTHIVNFYILGGEPFLNPEIEKYIYAIRDMLPKTELTIVTNGLLIPSLKSSVLKAIKDCNVRVSISEYQPTHGIIEEIREKLIKYNIRFEVRIFDTKQKFNRPLSLNKESEHKHLCISDGCVTIWNHKISRCPTLMYIGEFNRYFNTNLPEEGTLELNCDLTGQEILTHLKKEVPLCKHCIKNEIDWSSCGNEVSLSDFAVRD